MIKIVCDGILQKSTSLKYKYMCLINLACYCENINGNCNKCQRKTECDEFQFFTQEYGHENDKESVKETFKRWIS